MCRGILLDEALVGCPSDRDREPRDRPSDQSDLVRIVRMGRRGEPFSIRLGRALTREVEGDEGVIGLHQS
jgi:hypothetical protein